MSSTFTEVIFQGSGRLLFQACEPAKIAIGFEETGAYSGKELMAVLLSIFSELF